MSGCPTCEGTGIVSNCSALTCNGSHVTCESTECPTCWGIEDSTPSPCRYCDRLPECAHVCDRCLDDARAEQDAQRPDDHDDFHAYDNEGFDL